MLDETWGLSNKTQKYDGKYGLIDDRNIAITLKQKFGKGDYLYQISYVR